MRLLLEISDDKAAFIIELLKNFTFVKTRPLTPYHAEVLEELKESIDEVNEIKAGNKKAQPLSDFLNEL